MAFSEQDVRELTETFPYAVEASEGGVRYFLLPSLGMPEGREPSRVDALLCPTARDGYPSRLFLAQQVHGGCGSNWNASVRILERNWYALSWRVNPNLRLIQMVAAHLEAFR